MRKQLRFEWVTNITTTAGHIATSLLPSDKFTRDFINKHLGAPAGCYGFCPAYLEEKPFANLPIVIKGGLKCK